MEQPRLISAPFCVHSGPFLSPIDESTTDRHFIYDLFASTGRDRIYKNGSRATFGLVFGTLIHDLYTLSQSITATYLQDEDAQFLVVVPDFPMDSPSKSFGVKTIKRQEEINAYPISFSEDHITKAHLLALFTPPSAMSGSQRIMTTIQFILGQLDDSFNLQRFIELVEQEKWEEEAATFIAFRQTLLTMLISPPDEDIWEVLSTCRQIIIELNDPVLLSTGLVPILMDMAIHRFLSSDDASTKGTKKLIVLDNAQEYLGMESILTKSLVSLANMGANSPSSVLMIATEPSKLHLHLHFDFLLLGHISPCLPLWMRGLSRRQNIVSLTTTRKDTERGGNTNFVQIRPGQCAIYSPESIRFFDSSLNDLHAEKKITRWDETPLLIELEDLVSIPSSPPQTRQKEGMGSPTFVSAHFRLSKSNRERSTTCGLQTSLDDRHQQEFVNQLLSPAATNAGPVDTIANAKEGRRRGVDLCVDPRAKVQLAGVGSSALRAEPFSRPKEPSNDEDARKSRKMYKSTDYAPPYRELVSAILRVTNGRVNVKARYSKVLKASMFKEEEGADDKGGEGGDVRKLVPVPFSES
ncbi:hypothetical protein FRC17_003974, partial [Serendipita sp. 399]